jgi:hypothetical protein
VSEGEKMVQELQHQAVPEEFFNLTQLAEVTLIAGKLSTTDINEIKNYISKSDDFQPTNGGNENTQHNRILTHLNNHHYHHHTHSYESTKKKWKNHWEENFKVQEAQYENYTQSRVQAHESSPTSVSSPKTYAFLYSSCSSVCSDSCDDDSTKSLLSYSHKVFDRKKQRSFKQSSTESEYEFHFECQRPPYIANEMQHFKDTSCDLSASSELLKADALKTTNNTSCNEDNNSSMSEDKSDNFDGNLSESKSDVHQCPECGKKYSTSKCS